MPPVKVKLVSHYEACWPTVYAIPTYRVPHDAPEKMSASDTWIWQNAVRMWRETNGEDMDGLLTAVRTELDATQSGFDVVGDTIALPPVTN